MKALSVLWLALALCVPVAVLAQAAAPMYKLVDKNGKVTYAEKVPPGWQGQATLVDFDPNRNTATLPKAGAAPSGDTESGKRAKGASSPAKDAAERKERNVARAKQNLDNARAALTEALENPSEDEVMRVGNVRKGGGGPTAREVWSDPYKLKVEGLQKAVKDAEEALAVAEAA